MNQMHPDDAGTAHNANNEHYGNYSAIGNVTRRWRPDGGVVSKSLLLRLLVQLQYPVASGPFRIIRFPQERS